MTVAIAETLEELLERLAEAKPPERGAPMVAATKGSANGDAAEDHGLLGRLMRSFGLTSFERDLLVLLAGIEYDDQVVLRLEELLPGGIQSGFTFGHAFRLLPGAHWSALAPSAPLRRSRLIRMGDGPTLAHTPIRLEEATLHALLGLPQLDEALKPWIDWLEPDPELLARFPELDERLTKAWRRAVQVGWKLQVIGSDAVHSRRVLASFFAAAEMGLYELDPAICIAETSARRHLLAIWSRDAVLHDLILCFDVDSVPDPEFRALLVREVQVLDAPSVLMTQSPLVRGQRAFPRVEISAPSGASRLAIWREELGAAAPELERDLDRIVEQFPISVMDVREVAAELRAEKPAIEDRGERLWELSRERARVTMDGLAQLVEPRVTWDDLVLPQQEMDLLEELATHVRQRTRVYHEWGFADKWSRGLGVTALFSGPSGTGKSMAAEVLAHHLKLDLCRIDLSSTVSKYVGETEKNLRRIFDAAERSGAILVFEEADALFGRRSDQADGHTRHANIEVGYLLQRMEAYRGLAVLTSNLPDVLDPAFVRRIRFQIRFSFSGSEERERIWSRVFPGGAPLEELDFQKLARLSVSGAQIRDIALHAAFRAAEAGESVSMRHLLQSARNLMARIDRPMIEAEVQGWT